MCKPGRSIRRHSLSLRQREDKKGRGNPAQKGKGYMIKYENGKLRYFYRNAAEKALKHSSTTITSSSPMKRNWKP